MFVDLFLDAWSLWACVRLILSELMRQHVHEGVVFGWFRTGGSYTLPPECLKSGSQFCAAYAVKKGHNHDADTTEEQWRQHVLI